MLTHRAGAALALEDAGVLDEVVVDDWLHLENVDESTWCCRIGDARVMITLAEGAPVVDVIRGFYAVVTGSTVEHDVE